MKSTLVMAVALALLAPPAPAQEVVAPKGMVIVTVNGKGVVFAGQPPVRDNGRLLVPLRGVLEKMGASVRYSGPTRTVTATKGETRLSLVLGERTATVNGKPVTLDVPGRAAAGVTLVPLRFVAESLGADVRFDAASGVVAIRTDGKSNVIASGPTRSGTTKGSASPVAGTFTGVFLDFAGETDSAYTLSMTNGKTLVLRKDTQLLYNGSNIGFDDLRSGDKVVASPGSDGYTLRAVISDDDE